MSDQPPAETGDFRSGLRHLPTCLAVSGVIAAVAVPLFWWVRGPAGAAGAAAGVAVMALAYLTSAAVVVWVDSIDRRLLMPITMLTYILKIVMLGAVAFTARKAGWSGLFPMAVSAGVVIVAWPLAQLWWVLRPGRHTGEYEAPETDGAPRRPRSIA
ncbi:MAG: hypothetical protein ACRDT4_14115 [Micromonosporaceae bacterium]